MEQQQQQQQQQQEQTYAVLEAVIDAPAHLELRGWQSSEDSPEELEDRDTSLCLLACIQGHFLPVCLAHTNRQDDGTTFVQVQFIFLRPGAEDSLQ
jgi:hypothetical protein